MAILVQLVFRYFQRKTGLSMEAYHQVFSSYCGPCDLLIGLLVTTNDRASTLPSPLFRASTSFAEQRQSLQAIPSSKIRTAVDGDTSSGNRNRGSFSSFRFPHVPAPFNANSAQISGLPSDKTLDAIKREVSPRSQELGSGLDQLKLATRILSPSSIDGTPRSSVEFYSMSNNSTETLASEYITHQNSRLLHRPGHSRQSSCLAPTATPRAETLMMGYGQLTGSFTLDGSLVNQGPFEEVKGKGIIGGQGGGGVVRNKSAKRDSGLLGSLGWSNLGESFGGLLGGSELSSIKEAKDSTSAKSIPILSTPQSILFVDLKLGPGESKSYTYRNPLPKGIPPSHKGKAIKVSYSLVVGTQRAASVTQQHQVQRADIPFRVLTSVNGKSTPSSILILL